MIGRVNWSKVTLTVSVSLEEHQSRVSCKTDDDILCAVPLELSSCNALSSELAQAVAHLTSMQNQINAILAGTGGDLTPVMNEIYYNLSFARSDFTCFGCDGSCTGCSDIVVDDIYYNMDFTKVGTDTTVLEA